MPFHSIIVYYCDCIIQVHNTVELLIEYLGFFLVPSGDSISLALKASAIRHRFPFRQPFDSRHPRVSPSTGP